MNIDINNRSQIDPHSSAVLEFAELKVLLCSYCSTPLGRMAVGRILPSTQIEEIKTQLQEASEMKDLYECSYFPPLGGISDIHSLIDNINTRRVPLEPHELRQIALTLDALKRLKSFLSTHKKNCPALWFLVMYTPDFFEITEAVHQAIDDEGHIRDNASSDLHAIRKNINKLESKIQAKLTTLMSSKALDLALENRNLLTRNGRPVLAVKSGYRTAVPGVLHDRSNSGATFFIEPNVVAELVNELDDSRFEERREIARILWQLTNFVQVKEQEIKPSGALLGYLDLICAKAKFSIDYKMSSPNLTEAGDIKLKQARHPLLVHYEQKRIDAKKPTDLFRKIVPLDINLNKDQRLLIVTGPNTGGKTVALKTIGLLSIMAQSGLHIPADWGSSLPIFEQIHCDIGDEQSLAQSLSTFSSHMTHIVNVLKSANDKTLVLLDELGSGTDPSEGAALGTAILEHLRKAGTRAIVTTHLGDLKTYAYSTPQTENASMEFNRKTYAPTYRLLIGQPGSSNALSIAKKLGMPESVLEETRRRMDSAADDSAELINQVQESRKRADQTRLQAERLSEKLKKQMRTIKTDKQKAIDASNELVERMIREIKYISNDYAKTAQNAPKPWGDISKNYISRVNSLANGTPLAKLHQQFLKNLKTGDTVYVKSLQKFCFVEKVQARHQVVKVKIDDLMLDIAFDQLEERPFSMPDARIKVEPVKVKVVPKVKVKKYKKPSNLEQDEFIKKLKAQERAFAPALDSEVVVCSINAKKQTAKVKAGFLDMEIALLQLFPIKK